MKKALVVVSFGTYIEEVLNKNIIPVEDALKKAFPTYDFYRGFTSRFIVKKLKRSGVMVHIEKDIVIQLIDEGYDEILVQPTHVIPGLEYEEKLLALEKLSSKVKVGRPLLMVQEDYKRLSVVLNQVYSLETLSNPLVFMGHGTKHPAHQHYVQLGAYLHEHYKNVYVAGVEGEDTFDLILEKIKESSKVELAPLLLVAGNHVQKDMADKDEASWLSKATAAGLEVEIHLLGLGALEGVQQMIVENAKGI